MKNYQFEEILLMLGIIATILAYQNNIKGLFVILLMKTTFDGYCAIKSAYKAKLKESNKTENS